MFALVVLGLMLMIVAVETTLHVAALRAERRRAAACPFDDPDEHLQRGDVARLIASESALVLVALVTTPLAWLRARRPADGDTRIVVVQAPGSLPGAAVPLVARLRAGGHGPLLVRLPWRDVDATLAWLAVRLAAVRHVTGEPLDVVALGRAGLWVRALVTRHGRRAGVGRLLTVGTPHGGTEAAPWPPLAWLLRVARPGQPLVTAGSDATALAGIRECLAFASEHDALVEPPDAAYWPGAFNVRVRGLGHLGLAASPRIFELVRENLLEADAAAPARAGDTAG
jgi:hypothetical protein